MAYGLPVLKGLKNPHSAYRAPAFLPRSDCLKSIVDGWAEEMQEMGGGIRKRREEEEEEEEAWQLRREKLVSYAIITASAF